jgi:hypothetical protein
MSRTSAGLMRQIHRISLTTVKPRRIEFEELISALIAEHVEIRKKLADIKQSVASREFPTAAMTLGDLDRLFRQHVADEEPQVLRLLIETYGVSGAEDAICSAGGGNIALRAQISFPRALRDSISSWRSCRQTASRVLCRMQRGP